MPTWPAPEGHLTAVAYRHQPPVALRGRPTKTRRPAVTMPRGG